ncbi:MAG: TonB-dependent receptor [Rhodospirillaceae bacterium]|nr:TonB-dependent receptor [Rhodospirillaceae bacterium]
MSVSATAQQTPELRLEEIVVTARKVEERIQDTPITVTAFTAEALKEAGIRDLVDVAFLTPGFSMQTNSRANEQPFIRGMSANSFFRPDQLTSSFIDGIFVQGLARAIDIQGEVERIEVVKGPQSALYGRSTFAGAINYITRRPDPEQFEGYVTVSGGENDLIMGSLNVNVPMVQDRFAIRLDAQGRDYNGQFRDASSGGKIGDESGYSGSAQFGLTPNDNFRATARVAFSAFNDGHAPNVLLGREILNFSAGGTFRVFRGTLPTPPRNSVDLALERVDGGFRNLDQFRNHLILEWDFSGMTLVSSSHYAREDLDYFIDGDLRQVAGTGGAFESRFTEDFEDYSQDVRLQSANDSALRWLAGVSFYDSQYFLNQLARAVVMGNVRNERTYGVYGSVDFDLSNELTISASARYQNEKLTLVTQTGTQLRSNSTKTFLPRVILDYKPNDSSMLFASISRGNQPATFNTAVNTPPGLENLKEQILWNYELGTKNSLLDDRIRFNATGYFIDWTNQLVRFQTTGLNGLPITLSTNAGSTEILGFETEFEAVLTESWTALATFSYTDAEYQKIETENCLRAFGTADCGKTTLQNQAPIQVSLSSTYTVPITGEWEGFLRGDLIYRDAQYVDEINLTKTPSATLLNLRAGAKTSDLDITVFVNNVTNENSPDFATRFLDLTALPSTFGYQLALRRGREAGVTVSYDF